MRHEYRFSRAKFHPVVGDCYGQLAGGLKLLILGESHYPWPSRPKDETQTTFAALEARDQKRFWKNLESLIPVPANNTGRRGWDYVVFYNYVQHFVGDGPRDRPGETMWTSQETVSGFQEVLQVCKPDRVLVVGKKNWIRMAGSEQFPHDPPIPEPRFALPEGFCSGLDPASERNAYWYATGPDTYALCAPIYHPAFPHGFCSGGTAEVVASLLKIDWVTHHQAEQLPSSTSGQR